MALHLTARERKHLDSMRDRLVVALGNRLEAVVAYGPVTWGDRAQGELHLLVVTTDLGADTLARLRRPLGFWRRRGLPPPRLFTAELLARARDVFPLELADLAHHRELVFGRDPIAGLEIAAEHLRLSCEREMTEKLLWLRSAYATKGHCRRHLRHLLIDSFPDFCLILRGALGPLGSGADRGVDAAHRFARTHHLDPTVVGDIDRLRRGVGRSPPLAELFVRYYAFLEAAAVAIDARTAEPEPTSLQGASS